MSTNVIPGRSEYLFTVVDNLLNVCREWTESDISFIDEDGGVWKAVEETIEVFERGSIPDSCRQLEKIILQELKSVWHDWVTYRYGRSTDPTKDLPGNGFWRTIESIEDARQASKRRTFSRPERIADLVEQKVTNAQICRIWGWVNGDDRPELYKLEEELANPGRHTSNYVHPAEKRAREQEAAESKRLTTLRRKRQNKVHFLIEPSAESLEELVHQGVSAKQIARLRKITVNEVLAEAERLGLPAPQIDYADVRTARAPHEPGISEEAERSIDSYSRAGRQAPSDEQDDDFEGVTNE